MSTNSSRPIVAPYYAAAAVWLLYALCFPLYRPAHFICAAAASIAVFILAMGLCRSGAKQAGANADRAAQAAEEASTSKPASTGNAELDKTLKDGALALEEMRRLDRNIEDEKISADIVRLQQTSEKIFDYVKEHPDKLSDIRKFMNYYLPTTLKLAQRIRPHECPGCVRRKHRHIPHPHPQHDGYHRRRFRQAA